MEEGRKVLFLLLFLVGFTMELITGTMGAPDGSVPKTSSRSPQDAEGDLEFESDLGSSTFPSPPPSPRVLPSSMESASQGSSSPDDSSLTCWYCTYSSHGDPCYNFDPQNSSAVDKMTCKPEQKYCSVKRIWYVVETEENVNFSVNRTCSTECTPDCLVIGDRTKIHTCTSCCTESLCNIDNSSSSKETSNLILLMSAFLVAIAPMLSTSVVPNITCGKRNSHYNDRSKKICVNPTSATSKKLLANPIAATSFTNVFLSLHQQLKVKCNNMNMANEYPVKVSDSFQMLVASLTNTSFLNVMSMCNSSKSFDNF